MSRDFVVAAYIVKGGKVLLVHHKKLGRWLPIGGHIDKDELPEEALRREAMEEAGIEIDISGESDKDGNDGNVTMLLRPDHVQLEMIDPETGHQHIDLVYFAKARDTNVRLNDNEHHDIRWFSAEDIMREDIKPNVRHFSLKALEEMG
ncbi:MAG: NUDIX hydrolase [Candidatus Aenigmatarchaeota archaeon]|nr:MAG: NUDIX hydrolase [Candidatus Aenigmarchaeota archaeon]